MKETISALHNLWLDGGNNSLVATQKPTAQPAVSPSLLQFPLLFNLLINHLFDFISSSLIISRFRNPFPFNKSAQTLPCLSPSSGSIEQSKSWTPSPAAGLEVFQFELPPDCLPCQCVATLVTFGYNLLASRIRQAA